MELREIGIDSYYIEEQQKLLTNSNLYVIGMFDWHIHINAYWGLCVSPTLNTCE